MDEELELQTGPSRDNFRPSSESEKAQVYVLGDRIRPRDIPNPNSGLEVLNDANKVYADLRTVDRAVRNRWPITDEKRARIVEVCFQIADGAYDAKLKLMASKVMAQLDSINARREEASGGKNNVTVNVGVNVNAGGQAIDILSMSEQERETAIASGAVVDPKQLEHLSQDELVRLHRAACSVGVTSR